MNAKCLPIKIELPTISSEANKETALPRGCCGNLTCNKNLMILYIFLCRSLHRPIKTVVFFLHKKRTL